MKIGAITNQVMTNRVAKNEKSKQMKMQATQKDSFVSNPTFGGYKEVYNSVMSKNITTHYEAIDAFETLFKSAMSTEGFKKLCWSNVIEILLNKMRTYQFFLALSAPDKRAPEDEKKRFKYILGDAYNSNGKDKIQIEDSEGNNILFLEASPKRFIDCFRDDLSNLSPHFTFHNPERKGSHIEFYLDKEDDFVIDRLYSIDYGHNTSFYPGLGMKRDNRYNPFVSNTATYYNKDGSKNFFKNFIGV